VESSDYRAGGPEARSDFWPGQSLQPPPRSTTRRAGSTNKASTNRWRRRRRRSKSLQSASGVASDANFGALPSFPHFPYSSFLSPFSLRFPRLLPFRPLPSVLSPFLSPHLFLPLPPVRITTPKFQLGVWRSATSSKSNLMHNSLKISWDLVATIFYYFLESLIYVSTKNCARPWGTGTHAPSPFCLRQWSQPALITTRSAASSHHSPRRQLRFNYANASSVQHTCIRTAPYGPPSTNN